VLLTTPFGLQFSKTKGAFFDRDPPTPPCQGTTKPKIFKGNSNRRFPLFHGFSKGVVLC
jgi:hypothetical protein